MSVGTETKLSDTVKDYYDKLFQDGVLMQVHISVWGMTTKLNKDDLGLKEVPDIYELGKKKLIGADRLAKFKNAEGKARRYLYRNSHPFPVGEAHFVPRKTLPTVLIEVQKLKKDFMELVDDFVTNYEKYKTEVLDKHKDKADLLKPCYPPVNEVRGKFGFELSLFEFSMPREMSEIDIQDLIAREDAKEEVREQIREQLRDQYERSMRQLERFTEDAAKSLRENLVTVCQEIVDKINRNELVSKANLNTVREEIEHFRALNFLNDADVEKEIVRLEESMNGKRNFKDDAEALAVFNQSLTSVIEKASNVSDLAALQGNYFRKINL